MQRQVIRGRSTARPQVRPAAAAARGGRTAPLQCLRGVVPERKRVACPTARGAVAYSIVVVISVVVIAALIFAMDVVFTKAILALFGVEA